MQQFANPTRFLSLANRALPAIWTLTVILFAIGLYGALVSAPPDYQQGETVRIMFVHVPAAWLAMLVYTVMALASAVAIIFRHPLADVAAKTAAPIGAVFCFLALATGSLAAVVGVSGTAEACMEHFGLTATGIADLAREALLKKPLVQHPPIGR